jgi:MoaD family protein
VRIKVYATLRPIVGDREVDLPIGDGARVRDLVTLMVERWPDLAEMMLDEEGELSRRVHVFVDGRSSRHLPEGSDTRLVASHEIHVFPAVAGG